MKKQLLMHMLGKLVKKVYGKVSKPTLTHDVYINCYFSLLVYYYI